MRPVGGGTAESTALYRHMMGVDPLVERFVGPRWSPRAETWARGARWGLNPDVLMGRTPSAIAARQQRIDALTLAAVGEGVQQIVLMGAAFDTRPWRLEVGAARWFLVDHPSNAELRVARSGDLPALGQRVDVDVRESPLEPALRAAGFDPTLPTAWLLEGISAYVDLSDNRAALTQLAALSAPGSQVLLDVWLQRARGSLYTRTLIEALAKRFAAPVRWACTLEEAEALLAETGWALRSRCGADEVPGWPQAYAGICILGARLGAPLGDAS